MMLQTAESLCTSRNAITNETYHPTIDSSDKDYIKREVAIRDAWPAVLADVAGIPIHLLDGRKHPCPKCGGKNRFRYAYKDSGACYCNQCPGGQNIFDGIESIKWFTGMTFPEALNAVRQWLGGSNTPPVVKPSAIIAKPTSVATIDDDTAKLRDRVYSKLAETFGLSESDQKRLQKRGFTDAEIDRRGYWTSPQGSSLQMMKFTKSLDGESLVNRIPGLIGGPPMYRLSMAGLVVPVRDEAGRVIACKVRIANAAKDGSKYFYLSSAKRNGPSPGAPCHVALESTSPEATPPADVIRITEGEIKADLATAKTGVQTLGVAGVSSWKACIPIIETIKPKKVLIALDADAKSNRAVAKCLAEAWEHFTSASWSPQVAVETWDDQYKGIDDALAAGQEVKELGFKASADFVSKIQPKLTLHELLDDLGENEDPHDPARLARLNVSRYESSHGGRLRYWRGGWWKYREGQWLRIDSDTLDAKLRQGVNTELFKIAAALQRFADDEGDDKKPVKKKPSTNHLISNVMGELKSLCFLSDRVEMPSMVDGSNRKRMLLSLENGLLDLDRVIAGNEVGDCFSEHTPDWFSGTKLGFVYQPTPRAKSSFNISTKRCRMKPRKWCCRSSPGIA